MTWNSGDGLPLRGARKLWAKEPGEASTLGGARLPKDPNAFAERLVFT